jgi:hypothetical protein
VIPDDITVNYSRAIIVGNSLCLEQTMQPRQR